MRQQHKHSDSHSQARKSERPRQRRSSNWQPNFGGDFFRYKEVVDGLLAKPGLSPKQRDFLESIRFARQQLSWRQMEYLSRIQDKVYRD